jgi:release factor glutamine methyltransferase
MRGGRARSGRAPVAARQARLPALEEWIVRREHGEPLAWITGSMEFCGHRLRVDSGVYVPRFQTEALAARAAALLPSDGRAVDLCTGAGAIAVHLQSAVPSAVVIAVDVDERAVRCARRNGVRAIAGDLASPLRSSAFDVVTAVAPYVPSGDLRFLPADVQRFEPRRALDGGADGLDVVRAVVESAARVLRPGGWLVVELGGDEDLALQSTLARFAFTDVATWCDDEGDLRGLAARLVR